jgi:CDP-4-dehydro-6-deoxyglucose reductase/ferredoxin-NAD(P)+ reductase (naphthalene dioxygenase ferredoxin-specific)
MSQALSEDERKDGLFLACRAKPKTDLEIAWLGEVETAPKHVVRQITAKVSKLEPVARDVLCLSLEVTDDALLFSAGQYVRLRFGKLAVRSYSMANVSGKSTLEFHIRQVKEGLVSSYINEQLQLGDSVALEGPFGDSYWRETHNGPILALAGGTGLAPMLSITRSVMAADGGQPFHLYLGVQDEADVYAENELRALTENHPNFSYDIVLSEPSAETHRLTGFLDHILASHSTDLKGTHVYVAGPPLMVNAVHDQVVRLGVETTDVHCDSFTSSATTSRSLLSLFSLLSRWLNRRQWFK